MLHHLTLRQFRSHQNLVLELSPQTVLVGPNGAGKTNILEAIFFLATTSSFRVSHDRVLIEATEQFARVTGDELEGLIIREGSRTKKQFKLRGLPKKLSEVPGLLPVVLFSPEMLEVVDGGPSHRRRLFNIALSQLDRHLSQNLVRYREILKQRNALLQRIASKQADEAELTFWDSQLAEVGEQIVQVRSAHINQLNQAINQAANLLDEASQTSVLYQPTYPAERGFQEALLACRASDLRYSQTTVGPHRDDYQLLFSTRPLALFGSRGEWRKALLSIQFGEVLLAEQAGLEPLLLLDDVFSELDQTRRHNLSAALAQRPSVVTTTDKTDLSPELLEQATIIEVEKIAHA